VASARGHLTWALDAEARCGACRVDLAHLAVWQQVRNARRRPTRSALAAVYQVLYIRPMTRSATLPPIRIAPETKASLESVLREGESLTQFIENAVCREAEFRAEQNAAIARAQEALRRADEGLGLMTAEDFLAGMEQRARDAQRRIREAVSTRKPRATG
jgi:hypothetical protein